MLGRPTVVKLIVFAIVSVLGVGYAAWRYGGADELIGKRTYTVRLELATGGGIFARGEVTYRGVRVGQIGDMRLTDDGIEVNLEILRSAPPIPADTEAVVADRSAVGEQYIDLRPRTDSGPFLADESDAERVIAAGDTTTPPPVQELITNVDDLATSVPTDALRTVVNELDTGLSGTGGDLQRLLDTTSEFTAAARQNLSPTRRLLAAARTVLDTQRASSAEIRSFSSNLRQVADTLRGSDSDLRRLISAVPPAASQVNSLISENATSLGGLLANLLTTSNVLEPRGSALEQLLVTYPLVPPVTKTVLPGDGTAHIGLALNLFDPPPCVRGYQSTQQRPGNGTYRTPSGATASALAPTAPNEQAYCAEPGGSVISVRGSQNAPFPGSGLPAADLPTAAGNSGARDGTTGQGQQLGGSFGGFVLGPDLSQLLRNGD